MSWGGMDGVQVAGLDRTYALHPAVTSVHSLPGLTADTASPRTPALSPGKGCSLFDPNKSSYRSLKWGVSCPPYTAEEGGGSQQGANPRCRCHHIHTPMVWAAENWRQSAGASDGHTEGQTDRWEDRDGKQRQRSPLPAGLRW